jgi:hypothetical protein
VLEHLPGPAATLAVMAGTLRPGGWLLAESADPMLQPLACPDEHAPAQVLSQQGPPRYLGRRPGGGNLLRFGRTLPRLLRDAALTGVNAEARITMTGRDTGRLQRTLVLRHRDTDAGR